MSIYTLGNGFIANHLPYKKIKDRIYQDSHKIRRILEEYSPDVLINAIGFCGKPNIDECESQVHKTYEANTIIPLMLARECENMGIHFIHIGSGCVYFGESPNANYSCNYFYKGKKIEDFEIDDYISCDEDLTCEEYISNIGWKETDFANPESIYSKSKYAADILLEKCKNATILRIRMPISSKNDPRNFINKIRGYKSVIDIPNSVTFVDDLVRCVDWSIQNSKTGIYHVTNPEPLTAAHVIKEYQKYFPDHKFEIITESQLDKLTIAKRSNCILNIDKLITSGFIMTSSQTALEQCMKEYVKNLEIHVK